MGRGDSGPAPADMVVDGAVLKQAVLGLETVLGPSNAKNIVSYLESKGIVFEKSQSYSLQSVRALLWESFHAGSDPLVYLMRRYIQQQQRQK